MTKEQKLPYLEYFTSLMIDWYRESTGSNQNDLSTLKILKLLFFTSAVKANKNSNDSLLDKVFTNFSAMPYGHVESDVYDLIKQNELQNVSIDRHKSLIVPDSTFIDDQLSKEILESVNTLKGINKDLIKASSFDLVDLSHTWYSWQFYYSEAKKINVYSYPIPIQAIKAEEKIYML